MLDALLLERLRALIGKPVEYLGSACRVIEVLPAERALVLECSNEHRGIQGNQYGDASRRVRQYHTLPLFDDNEQLEPLIEIWLG